ncbi:MAG: DMT family transporter [Syntrophorhabdaceae bacterium]|nr:DMT family transporter [Syntrophorhabdaceae bacterium]
MSVEKEGLSDILLLCVAAIWGINFVAVKFLLTEISPVNLILFRFIAGSIFLFFLLLFFEDVKIPLKDFFYLCLLGAIGITIYQFFFTYALKYTSVTNVSIIINTSPLYGGILASLLGYEKFQPKRFFAIMTGFLGVYVLITKGSFLLEGGDTSGNTLAIVASMFWALYTILSKPLLDKHSPLKVTTYSMLSGAALLCPFIPFHLDLKEYSALSFTGWVCLLYSVIFSIVIAFFLWYRGVSRIGASRTMVYQYSVPVFAAFSAYLLLDEKLYISQLIGAGIIFSSITLARRK